ncbi:MAG: hypothetical protein VB108_02430 [Anaerolineaceae bacterium]|nr:hypothetical protein [Anaerolineaceae bacterium]
MPVELRNPIGQKVEVTVDRPLGSCHPEYPSLIYPINYGFIEGVMAADGEGQDAYILGAHEPLVQFSGVVIAVIHRKDDIENKWVVAAEGMHYEAAEIGRQTAFQEKFYTGWIET